MTSGAQRAGGKEQLQAKLKTLAEEVSADLSQLDGVQRKEVLSDFVSDLFLHMVEQDQREVRRQKQAEGIAAAKARGVRFGTSRKPLPENFLTCYEEWQGGGVTLSQAAKSCGMTRTTFTRAVKRMKEDGGVFA